MAYSYAQLQQLKTGVVTNLSRQQDGLETAKSQFTVIETALTNMQSQYAGWATEVNALAAANPNDPVIQALKAERDLLVAEFSSTKAEATTLKDAVAGA